GNEDPNLGNWLVDPSWNLILIDHSRTLGTSKSLYHELSRVDKNLWERMKALTPEQLTGALASWLEPKEVQAILARRDAMRKALDKLVKSKGEAAVLVN